MALGASTVAWGWSNYFADVMKEAGITIPDFAYGDGHNLIAAAIVLILTAVICVGIKISSQVNFVFVVIKVSIVLLVIVAGAFFIVGAITHLHPAVRLERRHGRGGHFVALAGPGVRARRIRNQWNLCRSGVGVLRLLGFDIVATAAEETKKPQRDMPIGIFASLGICTVLYVAVSLVVTGMVKYTNIKVEAPWRRHSDRWVTQFSLP